MEINRMHVTPQTAKLADHTRTYK